jgi:hypothetical protein
LVEFAGPNLWPKTATNGDDAQHRQRRPHLKLIKEHAISQLAIRDYYRKFFNSGDLRLPDGAEAGCVNASGYSSGNQAGTANSDNPERKSASGSSFESTTSPYVRFRAC